MGTPDMPPRAEPFEGLRTVEMDKVFYLGEVEVSQALWSRHMEINPSRFQSPSLPVEGITWQEAVDFCGKLNLDKEEFKVPEEMVFRLPSEAEWEYAAKAGSDSRYAWGDEANPDDIFMANTWQGRFPMMGNGEDGFEFIAPVGCFPENTNGLLDMIGNVWEWTDDIYSAERETIEHSHPDPFLKDKINANDLEEVYVIKGGSYLCAQNYCLRYRPAARQPQETGLGTNHLGFRTIKRIYR